MVRAEGGVGDEGPAALPRPPEGMGNIDYEKATGEELARYREQAQQSFENDVLCACANCGRTFLPDRLKVHQRSCTPAKPSQKFARPPANLAEAPGVHRLRQNRVCGGTTRETTDLREMRENAQTITAEMKGPTAGTPRGRPECGDLAFRIFAFCARGVLQTIESGGGWEM